MVAALLVCATAAAAVLHGSLDGLTRGRAQAIADVVALSAVQDPTGAAGLAQKNGARLESLESRDGRVTVVIQFDEHRATAAATVQPREGQR